jgi:hypothetical protein
MNKVITSIMIEPYQKKFLYDNRINLSRLVRNWIDILMKEDKWLK